MHTDTNTGMGIGIGMGMEWIPGIFTHNIPGIGSLPIQDLIPIPIPIQGKDLY